MIVFVAGHIAVCPRVVGPPSVTAGFCYVCFSNVVVFYFFLLIQARRYNRNPARRKENLYGFCGLRHIAAIPNDEIGSIERKHGNVT